MPYPTGPGTPIIAGVGDMSVDEFLRDPLRVQKVINAFPNAYFFADQLYTEQAAPAGAVVYSQLTQLDLYLNTDANLQPRDINPGDEFPAVDVLDTYPGVKLTTKNGGYFAVTDEDVRRDRRDVVQQRLRRLVNTLVQISNAKALSALLTDATVVASSTAATAGIWSTTSNNPLVDVDAAIAALDFGAQELGYVSGKAFIHPTPFLNLQTYIRTNFPTWLPREGRTDSPMFNKFLAGMRNLDWVVTRRMDQTKLLITADQPVGTQAVEVPPFTEVVPERTRQRTVVLSGRQEAFVCTEPYAVRVVTGIN